MSYSCVPKKQSLKKKKKFIRKKNNLDFLPLEGSVSGDLKRNSRYVVCVFSLFEGIAH